MTNAKMLAALSSVAAHQFLTAEQWDICCDVLIPGGYINAKGTWYLTAKGLAALAVAA